MNPTRSFTPLQYDIELVKITETRVPPTLPNCTTWRYLWRAILRALIDKVQPPSWLSFKGCEEFCFYFHSATTPIMRSLLADTKFYYSSTKEEVGFQCAFSSRIPIIPPHRQTPFIKTYERVKTYYYAENLVLFLATEDLWNRNY